MSTSKTLSRAVGLAGTGWGSLLAVRGPAIWSVVEGSDPTTGDSVAVKLLAVRHLGQGLAQAAFPDRMRALWLTVDLLHASTMAVLAARDAERRRAALLTGAVALLSALGTTISLARSSGGAR